MATTIPLLATLGPSCRTAVPAWSSATRSQAVESGSHTAGRSAAGMEANPPAILSAAIPDFSWLTFTETHLPSTLRGLALYAAANDLTMSAFSSDARTLTGMQGAAPALAAGRSSGRTTSAGFSGAAD